MPQRRFFILDETCPASEVLSMMCRVVTDKLLPLNKFAPLEPISSSGMPRHNTQDIIPNILPASSLSTDRKDFLKAIHDTQVSASLTSFFGLDFARSHEERLSLESQEVKRYTLNNPGQYFKTLMENELYAHDVHELLKALSFGQAYLVVGFLTTVGAIWTQNNTKAHSESMRITVPVAKSTGIVVPGLLDPEIKSLQTTTRGQGRKMRVAQEEIFAIAYNVVKTSHSFDRSAVLFIRKTPVVGPPRRAQARHLALSHDSDEEVEDSSDENDTKGPDAVLLDDEESGSGKKERGSFDIGY